MSDGELVRRALAGQAQAYEELVRRWTGRILAVCHARVRHADVAEDLAQETLLRGYRALASLAEPDKFGPWLCGIANHACLDWLKARERSQIPFSVLDATRTVDDLIGSDPRADGFALDREEELGRLMAAVDELPDDFREVVLLYYYDDVTYRDLAEMLGVSAATINARLTKARMLLRERLGTKVRR
jgi:RNA polymerase sigma-70 factor, ECF subfamily